jgi:hypothetical protein
MLRRAGIRISERAQEIDIVIASYDRGFDDRKLQIAFDAIWFYERAMLVTTNPDRYCPPAGGRGESDAAAIVAAVEACTGARREVNVGKPGPIMLESEWQQSGNSGSGKRRHLATLVRTIQSRIGLTKAYFWHCTTSSGVRCSDFARRRSGVRIPSAPRWEHVDLQEDSNYMTFTLASSFLVGVYSPIFCSTAS